MRGRRLLKQVTNGLFATTIDLLLFHIFLLGASVGKPRSSYGIQKMFAEALEQTCEINHSTVRSAWRKLTRQGFIETIVDHLCHRPLITNLGKQRLEQIAPVYQKQRPWDKRIYLITYDIPEENRVDRNLLRDYLKQLSAVMLQHSVWLAVYNPTSLMHDFVTQKEISGTILISNTGTNGSIGDESVEELVARLYRLEELNYRYKEFLSLRKVKLHEAIFQYLAILNDDPQLPFELLPDWWQGDEAYERYKQLVRAIQTSIFVKQPAS